MTYKLHDQLIDSVTDYLAIIHFIYYVVKCFYGNIPRTWVIILFNGACKTISNSIASSIK